MGSVEERVAYLEGRGEEHAAAIAEVRQDVRELRTDTREMRTEMNRRFDQVDARFDRIDARFIQMDARFDAKFTWMIGFQFATLMVVTAALLNVYFR